MTDALETVLHGFELQTPRIIKFMEEKKRDLLGQRVDSQPPGGHVEVVNPVVADLSIAIVAEHAPTAVEPMRIEGTHRRGPKPAIVVHAGGRHAVGQRLDLGPDLGCPSAGHFHLTNDPLLE